MDPYIGEIRNFAFGRIPVGWLPCDGRLLTIRANTALFSLIGTYYGGDGVTTFGIPNLMGVVPIHYSTTDTSENTLGEIGGLESVALASNQIPIHNHQVGVSSVTATLKPPTANFLGVLAAPHQAYLPYSSSAVVTLPQDTLTSTGGNQGHNNLQPYLVTNLCIATQGVYPPRP